jgi:hypothetical protein
MSSDEIIERVAAMPPARLARVYSIAGIAGLLPLGQIAAVAAAGRFGELCAVVSDALICADMENPDA